MQPECLFQGHFVFGVLGLILRLIPWLRYSWTTHTTLIINSDTIFSRCLVKTKTDRHYCVQLLGLYHLFVPLHRNLNPTFWVTIVQSLSHVWLFMTPWTAARQSSFPSLSQGVAQTHVHWVSWWCHPNISSSAASSFFPSFPESGSFPMSRLFASGSQSTGASASASVLPVNIQGWFLLGLTGLLGPCKFHCCRPLSVPLPHCFLDLQILHLAFSFFLLAFSLALALSLSLFFFFFVSSVMHLLRKEWCLFICYFWVFVVGKFSNFIEKKISEQGVLLWPFWHLKKKA